MRIFLAIEIPQDIKEKLVEVQEELRPLIPGVRWEKGEKLHLTLVFLGKVEEERVEELKEVVREGIKGVKGFNVELSGLRFFPNEKRPRVVLLEVGEGVGEFRRLQKGLTGALSEAVFEFARPGKPHVTLGRFKQQHPPTLRVGKLEPQPKMALLTLRVGKSFKFKVKEVVMVESKLHPAGAIHTPIARVPLGEREEQGA